jgi:hypothetical protein
MHACLPGKKAAPGSASHLHQLSILGGGDAHKHAGTAHGAAAAGAARQQRLAHALEQQALLRVHQHRLDVADGEGGGVKQLCSLQEDGEADGGDPQAGLLLGQVPAGQRHQPGGIHWRQVSTQGALHQR